ncbi:MAG: uracil-DNA glycosylase family protein [Brevundimonas sp.]
MVALSERLTAHLIRDWREDLEPVWRGFFEGVEPDLGNLPDWDVADLFPDRLELGHLRDAGEPVQRPHMLRAFDGLAPDRVRVVIIGQDPYTQRTRATGRAFEDGEWDENQPATVATSLQRLLQSAAALEHPNPEISNEENDWASVSNAIQNQTLAPPTTPGFFNALAAQGVLSVNAAWTFTGRNTEDERHLDVHLKVWKPVMTHLLRRLTWRDGAPIVFLLLGGDARTLFKRAVGGHFGHDAIGGATRLATIYSDHPAYQGGGPYFARGNPLRRVNQALDRLGSGPIRWWPDLPQAAA